MTREEVTRRNTMQNELRECPFCGGEAEIIENEYDCVDVSCKNMGCRGFTDYLQYGSRNEAIEAWNRRVNDGRGKAAD